VLGGRRVMGLIGLGHADTGVGHAGIGSHASLGHASPAAHDSPVSHTSPVSHADTGMG
jgi:hypothetical protein